MFNWFDNIKEINVLAAFLLPCPVMAVAILHFHDTTALVLRQYVYSVRVDHSKVVFSLYPDYNRINNENVFGF